MNQSMSTKTASTPITDRHQTVMVAITHCIERLGLRKTRMDDIAEQANVSRISLYREYGNRDTLINSFLCYRSQQFNDRVRAPLKSCKSIEEALEYYLLSAAMLASRDSSVRELVEVHHVLHSALNDTDSPIKRDILNLWLPLLDALCHPQAQILDIDHSELVDWIILMESNLILLVIESGWDQERLTKIIRSFLVPAFILHRQPN